MKIILEIPDHTICAFFNYVEYKPSAPTETRLLQRWVNNKIIFRTVDNFNDYDRTRG